MHTLSDIGSIPADFVKYFVMMCLALGGMWFTHRRGMQASGTKAEPVNIAQPLEVKHSPEWAGKNETDKELLALDQKIEAMARENLRQHNTTSLRINEVLEAGGTRGNEIIASLHAMEQRMTHATLNEIKSIHERLNPMEGKVEAHAEALKHHTTRMAELWEWICKLWEHVTKIKK